jgi:hypothetical protein
MQWVGDFCGCPSLKIPIYNSRRKSERVAQEEGIMDLSLRLDTLGLVEMRYLRSRERFRDWPPFQLLAASRQARIISYLSRDVAEVLHQQILMIESAVGLDEEDDDDDDLDDESNDDEREERAEGSKTNDRDGSTFSPAFAQALEKLNELAHQRLPDAGSNTSGVSENTALSGALSPDSEATLGDEEAVIEQLQGAFLQMMEVVRELAEEMSTDALKLTGRFRCARTNIEFVQAVAENDNDDDDQDLLARDDDDVLEVDVELVMVLQLFEEGRAKPDDLPTVELQLDVDDFERLHESLDMALEQERRSRRRK